MTVQRNAGSRKDNSNGTSEAASSRASIKQSRQNEFEARQLRGEMSCAECRRLKLRCDRKIPCSTCTRRGCHTICPLGERRIGQRLDLADTDELRQTIAEMSNRIRQLEDALEIEHGMRSSELHPLLRDEFHLFKEEIGPRENGEADLDKEEQEDELQSVMGLLTISDGGGSRSLGTGLDQALLAGVGVYGLELSNPMDERLRIPQRLVQVSQLWPFGLPIRSTIELHVLLESQLPSRERASGLGEAFLLNSSWSGRPVSREQIMEELIPAAYKRLSNEQTARMDLHDLALLYMVFAVGAAADLTLPPYNAEAERYRHLARAALGVKSVFDGGSLSVVQAIFLMGSYDVISGRMQSLESVWKMFCLASSLGASIGLHRDPAGWQLDPKIVHRRRVLFWEMCWVDNWKSLSISRPISLTPDAVDCELPEDRDAIVLANGTVVPSFWAMKNLFTKEVLSKVAIRLSAARPPKYSEILEMDRLVRDFDLPSIEQSPELSKSMDERALFSRRFVLTYFRHRVLLYIHRNYFARALLDNPNNPLKSPFSPSFFAAYSSATALLRVLKQEFIAFPHVFLRNWPVWAHALAASVVVGSVVTRSPCISLAFAAFDEFEQAIKLFKTVSEHPVLHQGLPFLTAMYERAKTALEGVKTSGVINGIGPSDVHRLVSGLGEGMKEEICTDVLKILTGSTRLMEHNNSSSLTSALPERDSESSSHTHRSSTPRRMPFEKSGSESPGGSASRLYGTQAGGSSPAIIGQTPEIPVESIPTGNANLYNEAWRDTHASNIGPDANVLYFPGLDCSIQEHPNVTYGLSPATSSFARGSFVSQQTPQIDAPPVDDATFLPTDPTFFSDFLQSSAPEVGSSLPIIDFDMEHGGQQTDDSWQSFMSDSGLETVDELMRNWQAY
ncbi:hypothetical protein SCHPADRAFT_907557 [Schizopora paradoxa]|uniref:Zn(2)-C6 fungal-type domain-containing protein n=1 Tax=Schizopora paradoxa TaxID=27342 RepID=A0A0H2RY10_9AGAM|nr:hypothetical protein SCHPADRAFT_907557 [Schizopora paradoxa]